MLCWGVCSLGYVHLTCRDDCGLLHFSRDRRGARVRSAGIICRVARKRAPTARKGPLADEAPWPLCAHCVSAVNPYILCRQHPFSSGIDVAATRPWRDYGGIAAARRRTRNPAPVGLLLSGNRPGETTPPGARVGQQECARFVPGSSNIQLFPYRPVRHAMTETLAGFSQAQACTSISIPGCSRPC
jgi:hypothetical protein